MASSDPASRLLLLMRHGKAESAGEQDSLRELTQRGTEQARLVGDYLASQGVRPQRVLVSPSVRTRATWEGVASALTHADPEVSFEDAIYDGGPGDVVELLRGCPEDDRVVLVIGHEPTISTLGHLLGSEDSDPGALAQARIGLPTGSMCVLAGELPSWGDLGEDSLDLMTIVRG